MTQIVLNIEDASLIPSLKKILGAIKGVTIDKMITSSKDIEAEKAYITETAYSGDSRSPIPMISVHSVGDLLYRRQS